LGYSILKANESKRVTIPLFEGVKDGTDVSTKEIEKVITIFGEEIVITKRKIKVGELVIKKRVTVNNKIEIDIKKEETTVKYTDVLSHSGTDES
jgi:stress response protein YsnF